jgi:hypothetical protein
VSLGGSQPEPTQVPSEGGVWNSLTWYLCWGIPILEGTFPGSDCVSGTTSPEKCLEFLMRVDLSLTLKQI